MGRWGRSKDRDKLTLNIYCKHFQAEKDTDSSTNKANNIESDNRVVNKAEQLVTSFFEVFEIARVS